MGLGALAMGGYFLYQELWAPGNNTTVPTVNAGASATTAPAPTGDTVSGDDWLETVPEGELETEPLDEELDGEPEEELGIPYQLMNTWLGDNSRISIYPDTGCTVFEIFTYSTASGSWESKAGTIISATDSMITVQFPDGTLEDYDFQLYEEHLTLAGENYTMEEVNEEVEETEEDY